MTATTTGLCTETLGDDPADAYRAAVDEAVAQFPPLTAAQRERLSTILAPREVHR